MAARGPRRRARSVVLLSAAAVTLAACNLLTGLDADYELKRDTSAGEGGRSDGGDGGAQTDSPSGLDAADGRASFCESRRDGSAEIDFFCSDFEGAILEGNGVPTGWSGMFNNVDGGVVRLVLDGGMDGSTALELVSETTSTASRQTRVQKRLLKAPAKEPNQYLGYELDFDFRVVSSVLPYEALGMLVFPDPGDTKEHGIAGYGPQTPHIISHQTPLMPATPRLDNDANWHHARVTLTHAAPSTPFNRTIEIDGNSFEDTPTGHTIDAGAPTEVWFGIFNTANNAGRAHAQFDNVVVRRTP